MKKITSFLIVLSITFLSYAQGNFDYARDFKTILAKTKDSNNNLYYNKLLKRYISNDSTLTRPEILALLIGFTDKPDYKPYNIVETEKLIYELNDVGKFKEAYDTGLALLKIYPFSFNGLEETSYAIEKLGNLDSANYYLDLVAKIMSAMAYSGDGTSPEAAMFAIGPSDGKHLIRRIGMGVCKMGSGIDENGNFLDMLQACKNEMKIQMYFNIQHAVSKMFSGKSAEEFMNEQLDKKK